MSGGDAGHFNCDGCGKSYRRKPELAGKKVRCGCGQVMRVPRVEAVREDVAVEPLALADVGKPEPRPRRKAAPAASPDGCPSCSAAIAADAILCVQCGYNLKTGKAIRGGRVIVDQEEGGEGRRLPPRERTSEEQRAEKMERLKGREIPIALILMGLGLNVLWAYQLTQSEEYVGRGFGFELLVLAISMVVGVALLVVTCFIAAPLLETTFGGIGSATLKLAAIYVTPDAVAALAASQAGEWGWVVSFLLSFGTYFGLLIWLFDLDLFEAAIVAIISYVINNWAAFLLIMALFRGGMAF